VRSAAGGVRHRGVDPSISKTLLKLFKNIFAGFLFLS
jgi:hypothetical protein